MATKRKAAVKKKKPAKKKKKGMVHKKKKKKPSTAAKKKAQGKKTTKARARKIVKKALAKRKPVSGFDYATLFSSVASASPVEDPNRPLVIHYTYLIEFTCLKQGKIVKGIAVIMAMNPPHARRVFLKKMENEQLADPACKALDRNKDITVGNFLKLDHRQHSVNLFAMVPPEKEAASA